MSDKEKLQENKQPQSMYVPLDYESNKKPRNSNNLTKNDIKNQLPKNPPKPPSK